MAKKQTKKDFLGENEKPARAAKVKAVRVPRAVDSIKITIPRNPRAAFELGRMIAAHT